MTDQTQDNYIPPTPDEIRALLSKWELSGAKAGAQVDINGRQVRKYTGGQAKVPYPVLFTLFAKNDGVFISKLDWRENL